VLNHNKDNKQLETSKPIEDGFVSFLLNFSRAQKTFVTVLVDSVLLIVSVWLAFVLRLADGASLQQDILYPVFLAPVITIPLFIRFRLYKSVIRYLNENYWKEIAKVLFVAICVWFISLELLQISMPRSILFLYALLAFISVVGSRIIARNLIISSSSIGERRKKKHARNICIYGAGAAGRSLSAALSCSHEFYVIAFIDDDPSLQGREIQGKMVYSADQLDEMKDTHKVDEILLALPSAPRVRKLEIITMLENKLFEVRSIPGVSEIALGNVRKAWFQGDFITQILGRKKADPNDALLSKCITGKNIFVTGAGGSIGSELCRQIIAQKPAKLILFELSEVALYEIEAELTRLINSQELMVQIVGILGTAVDRSHLQHVMEKFKIETLYHAAAYKHVPIVEHNMATGLKNNIFGTLNAAEAAVAAGVTNFVLVSTDKAVRPTNVMGASKRMSELVIQAISAREKAKDNPMRLSMVRFGNVLGSSGSVIPLFIKQIRMGGPVTLTDVEINRFFMTIPEAASLVIQAGSMGNNGDVFVLNMGDPIKIIDLARRMIQMAGFSVKEPKGVVNKLADRREQTNGEIAIVITGLRPGEKLYEELLIGDNVTDTEHELIMRASEVLLSWEDLTKSLDELMQAIIDQDCMRMRDLLLEYANGYKPDSNLVDFLKKDAS
jgi:FlaA1/EpsC-like NDP-sugar epimerase